jgi:hypothetical protein
MQQTQHAAPSRELSKLWYEWIDLHGILQKGRHRGMQAPAAPFLSAVSNISCKSRILLVGKATAKSWWPEAYRRALRNSPDEAISERSGRNREFVQNGGNGGSFWKFFGRLADLDPDSGQDSVIWTNVAKIGSEIGNPRGLLLSAQADLAERTLRAEIKDYSPVLTVFVAGSDKDMSRIINRALGISDGEWIKSEEREPEAKVPDVWWREQQPTALWTAHPQGASSDETEYWIKKVRDLTGS